MADYIALGSDLVRLGQQQSCLQADIRALDDEILELQRQRDGKIAELSGVEAEKRTTIEQFGTELGVSVPSKLPKKSSHRSPATPNEGSPMQRSLANASQSAGPRPATPLLTTTLKGQGKGTAATEKSTSIPSKYPQTPQHAAKETGIISKIYPTVVKLGTKYFEIWCKECGANIDATTHDYFPGVEGMKSHYHTSHRPFASSTLEDFYKTREVSDSDVQLMLNGEDPEDVPIQPTFGTYLVSNKRDSAALMRDGRGKGRPTKPMTVYDQFQTVEQSAAASVAEGWTSPSSELARKKRRMASSNGDSVGRATLKRG